MYYVVDLRECTLEECATISEVEDCLGSFDLNDLEGLMNEDQLIVIQGDLINVIIEKKIKLQLNTKKGANQK